MSRFDLEQEILDCWKITDDIKLFARKNATKKDFDALILYYNMKFDKLWETFESKIADRSIT